VRTQDDSALARASELLREVALLMGMSSSDADEVAKSGAIQVNGRSLVFTPAVCEDAPTMLLITLITAIAADTHEGAPSNILPHAPGFLIAHRASLGLSPDGEWLIHRSIDMQGMQAPALSRAIVATRWLEALLVEQSIH
jgi:hypothetical protein